MIQRHDIVSHKSEIDGRTRWARVSYVNRVDGFAVLASLDGGWSECRRFEDITTF